MDPLHFQSILSIDKWVVGHSLLRVYMCMYSESWTVRRIIGIYETGM